MCLLFQWTSSWTNNLHAMIELIHIAKTAECFSLRIQLELDNAKLKGCRGDLSCVCDLWIMDKTETATRRNLLDILRSRAIGQNDVMYEYKEYLKTSVSLLKIKSTIL